MKKEELIKLVDKIKDNIIVLLDEIGITDSVLLSNLDKLEKEIK